MELKNKLIGKKVYFDTNIIIYLVEGFLPYQKTLDNIQALLESDEIKAYSSELSLCETLIKPFQVGSTKGVSLFCSFLQESACFELFPIDKNILIQSSYIAADKNMKIPDAIHVATAMASGCEIFLTNDKSIQTPKNLEKILLSDYLTD